VTARIIDGRAIAAVVKQRVRKQTDALAQHGHRRPGLAVVLVGDDPASRVYVRNKRRSCDECGIVSVSHDLPASTTQSELLDLIARLNADATIDGVLVQVPLPAHIDEEAVIEHIDTTKDVDGFHPYNVGRLAVRNPLIRPCTPYGCMQMLEYIGVDAKGMHAVVVGASNQVGRPMMLELLLAGATVTICHRFTRDLQTQVERADIVVAAAGKPGLVKGAWIKPGAIVLDIGINRMPDGKLVGDVEFESALERAGWITPVPGGVGQMTPAVLMENTLLASIRRQGVADV
jgi:methylenetetrahydrofolate dehydrogenase (NADP+) / methenyltetrahydrofolate cyclohydrolase